MSWMYQLMLIVIGVCEVHVTEFSLDKYHTYEELTNFLQRLATENSDLARLYSIGKSVEGRELWVVEISAGNNKFLRPNVKLIGNIHGNEAVGREILMQLSKFLVDSYKNENERIRSLLDFGRVHILPSLNPDGFKLALSKWSGANQCTSYFGRNNILDLDLNRNFPDPHHLPRLPIQNETLAVMNWLREESFVLSASLHGGALVASYPYDSQNKDVPNLREPHLTPDDDVFEHLALGYASRHPIMHKGEACPGQNSVSFPQGVTNGAAWYPLIGGMQDYNYIEHGCMELTLEISCCKFPNSKDLPQYWDYNREPLLSFVEEVRRGIRGVVIDEEGAPIPRASLYVKGRNITFHTTKKGEFWRILLPNSYLLHVYAEGFQPQTISIKINDPQPNKWSQFISITLFRNESKAMKTNQAIWSNASLLDERSQETDSSTLNTASSTELFFLESEKSSTEEYFKNQPRGYLVEESKSISDHMTQDCAIVFLFPLTVLYLK